MSSDTNEEAAELAQRAAGQGKNAARNAGRAAKAAAEPVVERVADEARETVQKLEGTAEDAVRTARRFNPRVLSRMSGDTGVGFLALSVAVYAGTLAVHKFRQAASGRGHVIN